MKVFISWSGTRSKAVALALRGWLPKVIQAVKPWMSEEDIGAGARWADDLKQRLEDTRFGIICLTPDNLPAPWIYFEAGALSKTIADKAYVCPYLLDVNKSDIEGPLTQFQAKDTNEEGTKNVIQEINKAMAEEGLPPAQLDEAFEKWWPELEKLLQAVPPPTDEQPSPRDVREIVEETLEGVRGLIRMQLNTADLIAHTLSSARPPRVRAALKPPHSTPVPSPTPS